MLPGFLPQGCHHPSTQVAEATPCLPPCCFKDGGFAVGTRLHGKYHFKKLDLHASGIIWRWEHWRGQKQKQLTLGAAGFCWRQDACRPGDPSY